MFAARRLIARAPIRALGIGACGAGAYGFTHHHSVFFARSGAGSNSLGQWTKSWNESSDLTYASLRSLIGSTVLGFFGHIECENHRGHADVDGRKEEDEVDDKSRLGHGTTNDNERNKVDVSPEVQALLDEADAPIIEVRPEDRIIVKDEEPPGRFLVFLSAILWCSLLGAWITLPVIPLSVLGLGAWLISESRLPEAAALAGISWLVTYTIPLVPALPKPIRRAFLKTFRAWFPESERHYAAPLAGGPVLYCWHPHGIFSVGMVLLISDLDRPSSIIGAPLVAWAAPLMQLLCRLVVDTTVIASTGSEITKAMKEGRTLIIVPGGFNEITLAKRGMQRVYLKKRSGFMKLAMEHGYSVVPVYGKGEQDTYHTLSGMEQLRMIINAFMLPVLAFWGYPLLPLVPRRVKGYTVVCGPEIRLPKVRRRERGELEVREREEIDDDEKRHLREQAARRGDAGERKAGAKADAHKKESSTDVVELNDADFRRVVTKYHDRYIRLLVCNLGLYGIKLEVW